MRNSFTLSGKLALLALFVMLTCISAFAQVKLRNALDSDGDHRADYTIFRPSNNTWYIARSNGGIVLQPFGVANDDFMAPGDFDGDGIMDIAVWRDSNGNWYRLNSATTTFTISTWGQSGDEPVARDYDGDGKTDMAVVRRANGVMTWYVFGSLVGINSFQFGVPTDFTAPGDYDGDGKFDPGVQRPGASATAPATFFYLTSRNSGFNVVSFGQSNDIVVPGDYDGDGSSDLAVVREGASPTDNLTWIIRYSTTGEIKTKNWGVTGTDLTAQNDYDGDGKTDMTVWRNSNGQFYVLRSSNGGIDVVSWGAPNDFPVAAYDTH